MMLTEEEAKTKWCPFVRDELLPGPPFMGQPKCITTACMAWRWCEERNMEAMEHYEACAPGIPCTPPKPIGYCGRVGRPA